ncbi:MAG: cob(I)yrinic acid a,c-diamide adenosyltransferase [Dehalococcoidia bacterium]|nr:cob(I)yrinic acid a,c-diamide adenosyltransferase [Dehalococcoidia bacterium]MSQ34405.1 cob(I)yrinic acid a,c-diamide adenosyltransferase [Dehalococcoidia bacterium]
MPVEETATAKPAPKRVRKGLVIINTGNGKGKSTAAFGVMLRAWGRGMKVCAVQFIKSEKVKYGEQLAAEKLGIEMVPAGRGFTWTSKDLSEDAAMARHGWDTARERVLGGEYDVVVLDEITYPIRYGWLDVNEVLDVLKRRPPMVHVILTGRNAQPELVEFADLVTEMTQVKHPYHDQGIKAQKGVEF